MTKPEMLDLLKRVGLDLMQLGSSYIGQSAADELVKAMLALTRVRWHIIECDLDNLSNPV